MTARQTANDRLMGLEYSALCKGSDFDLLPRGDKLIVIRNSAPDQRAEFLYEHQSSDEKQIMITREIACGLMAEKMLGPTVEQELEGWRP